MNLLLSYCVVLFFVNSLAFAEKVQVDGVVPNQGHDRDVQKRGVQFLADLFDPELSLLPEFRRHSVYWLYHDNYLAAKVLADSHPQMAERIENTIREYGEKSSGKIEILFGEIESPLPFKMFDLVEVKRVGDRVVRTERVKADALKGWEAYADLLFFAAIALAEDEPNEARKYFATAMEMWDGNGFADAIVKKHRVYATYKLSLAIIAADRVGQLDELPPQVKATLLKMQSESGGWITDYKPDGTPIGKANVETTCMAILALRTR